MAQRRYGTVEYGDILDVEEPHERLGRLVIDFDRNEFWQRPDNGRATRRSYAEIAFLVAHDLIVFDQPGSKKRLVDYLMRIEQRNVNVREDEIASIRNARKMSDMKENTKLVKKVRRKARIAKSLWLLGWVVLVALTFVALIPSEAAPAAAPSIAGVGEDYGVNPDEITDATYIEALGSGSQLYGVVTDKDIVEVGNSTTGESTIKENVLYNPLTSDQPIHMRPLYYDRTTFYQTALKLNDNQGGSMGVYLQNPNGYSLGKPANELVLTGGQGLSTIVLCAPEAYQDASASDTASDIEDQQSDAAEYRENRSNSNDTYTSAEMMEGWNGFDSADIDGNTVVGSYWYTKDNSGRQSDLMRRIAVFDITNVMTEGADEADSMEAVQLNYQDEDSNYYAPVVSVSPSSNGAVRWIGYMKEEDGESGFFIRRYERNEDILMESYDNTFSTEDLTGNTNPISNYTLYGDKLFYEQAGSIWVVDLSRIEVEIDGNNRTIRRENPVEICKASDILPSVTRDEEFTASVNGTASVPICHYRVMTLTTQQGVQYGIAFVEADTGNLVYQPCESTTASASSVNAGSGIGNSVDAVQNQNEAGIQKERDNQNESSSNGGVSERIEMPNVVGLTVEEAEQSVRSSGLDIDIRYEANATVAPGEIIRTDPEAGDSTTTDEPVMLFVSSGKDGTEIPTNSNAGDTSTSGDSTSDLNENGGSEPFVYDDPDTVGDTLDAFRQGIEEQTQQQSGIDGEARFELIDDVIHIGRDGKTDTDGVIDQQVAENDNGDGTSPDNGNGNSNSSSDGNAANGTPSSDNASNGTTSRSGNAAGGENSNGRIIVKDVKASNCTIVAYTVRGEQFMWIEQDAESGERHVMISPVYYKNDAMHLQQDDATQSDAQADNANASNQNGNGNANENGSNAVGSDIQQQEYDVINGNVGDNADGGNENGNAADNEASNESENANSGDDATNENEMATGLGSDGQGDAQQTVQHGNDSSDGDGNQNDNDKQEEQLPPPTNFVDVQP